MADGGRTSTTLDIKVKTEGLTRLDRVLKATFKPGTARDLNRQFQGLTRTIDGMVRGLSKLGREMLGQRTANRAYKDLRADLQGARKEAEKLRAEMDRLRGSGAAPGGPGASQGGYSGGSGGGGRYQGAGQIPVPSAGALAQAFQAIPYLGALGAAGVMGSFQMYGSALRHQTARRDTFSTLGLDSRDMLSQTYTPGRAAYTEQVESPWKKLEIVPRINPKTADDSALSGVFGAMGALGLDGGLGSVAARQRGRQSARGSRLVVHGEIPEQYGHPMGVAGLDAVGVNYGVNSTQAMQEASGLSRSMGRRTSADEYDFAKAAQLLFGVDLGQTGGMMKSGQRAFGDGSTDMVARTIGTALQLGLEGSEISEYLSGIQGIMQRQAQLGQTSGDIGSLLGMQRRLGASGLSGHMAGSVANSFAQGAANIGMSGSGGAEEFMLLRAMGYTGTGGPEEYAKYKLMLQDPTKAVNALPGVLSQVGVGGELGALMTQRLMSSYGTSVHADTARQLAGGIAGDPGGSGLTSGSLTGAARTVRGYAVGLTGTEAGQENQRIGVGYQSASQVQALNQIMIDLAATVQNVAGPALTELTGLVSQMGSAVNALTSTLGGSGLGGAGGM